MASDQETQVDNGEVYDYALKVAYLAYLTSPKVVTAHHQHTQSIQSGTNNPESRSQRHLNSITKHSDAWTSALWSIGDTFKDGRDGGKGVRFPKELIKVLEGKIQKISFGADPAYSDLLLRASIGAFYGVYTQQPFQRQMKEERKVEALILMFVTTAQSVLRKRLQGDEWKSQLNHQVGLFVKIIRECLRSKECKHASPDLLQRLDSYASKLVPPPSAQASSHQSTPSEPDVGTPSSSSATLDSAPGVSTKISDMPMVVTVGKLFRVSDSQLQKDLDNIRPTCTERAALGDLKSCINNISQGSVFPGRRSDFDSDHAYNQWRTAEIATLQQLMLTMIKFNPELVKSTGPDETIPLPKGSDLSSHNTLDSADFGRSRSDSIGSDGAGGAAPTSNFVFIPSGNRDPKAFYKRLLDIALDFDLETIQSLGPDEEVSLQILSKSHIELVNECAIRWRIMHPFRVCAFFYAITTRYSRGECPIIECVSEALSGVQKITNEWEYDRWAWPDRQFFFESLSDTFDAMLRRIFEIFKTNEPVTPDEVGAILDLLSQTHENDVFVQEIKDLDARLEELKGGIGHVAVYKYEEQSTELFNTQRDVVPFFILLDWLKKEAKQLDKRFKQPILNFVDMPSIFLSRVCPEFLRDLNSMKGMFLQKPRKDGSGVHDADVIDLYKGVLELSKMHDAFCPEPLKLDLSAWFEPFVRRWLDDTDKKTEGWVREAIKADQFVGEGEDQNSSSIVDLLDSCKSAVDFLENLQWPDEYQNALFFTSLSKIISKCMELYCSSIEELFMAEMFPRDPSEPEKVDNARPNAWLVKARGIYQTEKKIEAFQFSPKSCVKLNNIQAARNILDRMYSNMDADDVSRIVESHRTKGTTKNEPGRYLFTVKIVLAEGIAREDGNPKADPFLTLSDERGKRIAKTRTLYETGEPRWDETFDIPVQGSLWIAATIWHRKLVDDHEMLGRAYICLDPRQFGNFLPRDLWFDLDTMGRLFMRISMEGEKDDIQFYFGRAFRSLKRAESEMVRNIVDKLAPFIHQYLSLENLKTLVKTGVSFFNIKDIKDIKDINPLANLSQFDIQKARSNAWEVWQKQFGSGTTTIPPVEEEAAAAAAAAAATPGQKKDGPKILTDQEIEEAIVPLFDIFDNAMEVWKASLSPTAWQLVMTKIWKEILHTIEGLLIPPLSDQQADRRPLTDKEVDIVFKWLKFLTTFFNAGGQEGGVPIEDLQNAKFDDLMSIRLYYDWHADSLMEECVRLMQNQLREATTKRMSRAKSVMHQRNLGTIKKRKQDKKQERQGGSSEIVMRILRMRPGTTEFLTTQMQISNQLQQEQQNKKPAGLARKGGSGLSRGSGRRLKDSTSNIPPVPEVPPVPQY